MPWLGPGPHDGLWTNHCDQARFVKETDWSGPITCPSLFPHKSLIQSLLSPPPQPTRGWGGPKVSATLPCPYPEGHIWRDRGRLLLEASVVLVADADVVELMVEEVLPGSYQAGFHCPTIHSDVIWSQLMGADGLLLEHIPVSNG